MSFKRKWGGTTPPASDPEKVQHVPATEQPFDRTPAPLSDADSAIAAELARQAQEEEEAAERRATAEAAELARNLVGEPTSEGAPDERASPSSPPLPQTQSVPMRVQPLENPPPSDTQSTSKEADPLPYAPPTHVRVGGRSASTVVQEFGPRRSRKVDGNPDDLPITNDPPHVEPVASSNDPANVESKPSDDPQHNLVPRASDAPELVQRAPELEESEDDAARKHEREIDTHRGLDDVDDILTPVRRRPDPQ